MGMSFAEIMEQNTPGVIKELWDSSPFRDDPEFLALTVKQQKFIIGYGLRDLRGWTWGDCAKFASPIPLTNAGASVSGGRLAQHKKILPFLRKWDRILVERFAQSADRIWQEEQSIAFSDIVDYLDEEGGIDPAKLKELPRSMTAAISSIEITYLENGNKRCKLKLWDKTAALGRLERMKNMNAPEKVIFAGVHATLDNDMDPKEAAQRYSELIRSVGE